MPLYEYECKKCHHRFEEIQQYSDPPIKKCPKCKKGKVVKLPSAPAVQFKGTGWYVTDYGRKGTATPPPSQDDKGGKGGKESDKKDASKDAAASVPDGAAKSEGKPDRKSGKKN